MRSEPEPNSSAPVLVAVGGRVASGKTHVGRGVAERFGAEFIESDRLRAELLEDSPVHGPERALGPFLPQEVYAELRHRVAAAMRERRLVVAEACYPREAQREALRSLALAAGGSFLFVECRVDEQTERGRLLEREASGSAGWIALAESLARTWEPVRCLSDVEYCVVDTSRPVVASVDEVLARLAERRPPPPARPGALAAQVGAVTFDCWNTLLFEPSWQEAHARRVAALADAAAEAGREVTTEAAGIAFDAAWERHMRLWQNAIASGSPQVATWALAELGLREPHPALDHLVRRFEEASHSEGVRALPGAAELLERLRRAGLRCALVCDTGLTPGRVVRRHLEALDLLPLLEVQVFSDEVGVPKPDPRAFQAALAPFGVEARRAVHVGDLRRTDVAGARGIGMATVRLHARHDDVSELPDADHRVASHGELAALLGV